MKVEEIFEYTPDEVVYALAGGLTQKQICRNLEHFIFVINSVDVRLVSCGIYTKCIFTAGDVEGTEGGRGTAQMIQEAIKAIGLVLAERVMFCEG